MHCIDIYISNYRIIKFRLKSQHMHFINKFDILLGSHLERFELSHCCCGGIGIMT